MIYNVQTQWRQWRLSQILILYKIYIYFSQWGSGVVEQWGSGDGYGVGGGQDRLDMSNIYTTCISLSLLVLVFDSFIGICVSRGGPTRTLSPSPFPFSLSFTLVTYIYIYINIYNACVCINLPRSLSQPHPLIFFFVFSPHLGVGKVLKYY